MKKAVYIILLFLPMAVSCTKMGIIPKDTLSDIYYDILVADKYIDNTPGYSAMADSLLVYEPIFNQYGYTTKDYMRSSDYYLAKPGKYAKIYKSTQNKLKKRRTELERIIAIESGKSIRWKLLDSLEAKGDPTRVGNAYYRTLNSIFFVPDTIPVTSPSIDSAIIVNIKNSFFLYDSLTTFDGKITILKEEVKTVKKKERWKRPDRANYNKTNLKKKGRETSRNEKNLIR